MKTFKMICQTSFLVCTLLCASILPTFTSCDNDEAISQVAEQNTHDMIGTYVSTMSCNVMGQVLSYKDISLQLTSSDNGTVTLVFGEFGDGHMRIPSLTMTAIPTQSIDGKAVLIPTDYQGTLSDGKSYKGKVQGEYTQGKLDLKFTLKYGAMPMEMVCTYSANRH